MSLKDSLGRCQRSIVDSGIDVGLSCFSSLTDETASHRSVRQHDPLLVQQGRLSPIDFGRYDPDSLRIELSPPAFLDDSLNGNIFIDAIPDNMIDSLNSSVAYSPHSLAGDENPFEVFQDLRHTSTPKQQSISVLEPPRIETSQARKRIKFTEGSCLSRQSRSWHVLHDITSTSNLTPNSESFIKISENLCKKKSSHLDTPIIRKVPILRGNSRRIPDKVNQTCADSARQSRVKEFQFPERTPSVRDKDKWLYYTGFTNYDLMFRVLSHISVPPDEGLTSFQILIMTLMKLKCDLKWPDLSHRFELFEPTVYSLFHSTLSLLYYSLSDVIPWTLLPSSRSNITVFIYALPFRSGDSLKNIFIFITDSKCPVLYVSEPVSSTQTPLSILPPLSHYFLSDDQICVKGLSLKNKPTFLQINKSSGKMTYSYIESSTSSHKTKFLRSCQETVRSIVKYTILLSKVPVVDDTMRQIVSVICSLVNIRTSEQISDCVLKNILKRSYKAPCVKHPRV